MLSEDQGIHMSRYLENNPIQGTFHYKISVVLLLVGLSRGLLQRLDEKVFLVSTYMYKWQEVVTYNIEFLITGQTISVVSLNKNKRKHKRKKSQFDLKKYN